MENRKQTLHVEQLRAGTAGHGATSARSAAAEAAPVELSNHRDFGASQCSSHSVSELVRQGTLRRRSSRITAACPTGSWKTQRKLGRSTWPLIAGTAGHGSTPARSAAVEAAPAGLLNHLGYCKCFKLFQSTSMHFTNVTVCYASNHSLSKPLPVQQISISSRPSAELERLMPPWQGRESHGAPPA